MISHFAPLGLLLAAAVSPPAPAQDKPQPLPLEARTSLRCAAAFAIVSDGQAKGNPAALVYPAMGVRGREFFVRVSARVMDDTGMDRTAVAAALKAEALALAEPGALSQIMPACLLLLDASGV